MWDIGYHQPGLHVIGGHKGYEKNEKHLFFMLMTGGFLLVTFRIGSFIKWKNKCLSCTCLDIKIIVYENSSWLISKRT